MAGIRRTPPHRGKAATKRRTSVPRTRGKAAKPSLPSESIWAKIIAIGESIPPEALSRLPRDGARNLDHYLYGAPKEE